MKVRRSNPSSSPTYFGGRKQWQLPHRRSELKTLLIAQPLPESFQDGQNGINIQAATGMLAQGCSIWVGISQTRCRLDGR